MYHRGTAVSFCFLKEVCVLTPVVHEALRCGETSCAKKFINFVQDPLSVSTCAQTGDIPFLPLCFALGSSFFFLSPTRQELVCRIPSPTSDQILNSPSDPEEIGVGSQEVIVNALLLSANIPCYQVDSFGVLPYQDEPTTSPERTELFCRLHELLVRRSS